MELLGRGRDCDVFDLGDGTVLRRSRSHHDQAGEARVLAYAAEHDYPVPAVVEVRAGGGDLVMEKVVGPTMADDIKSHPWRAAHHGRLLAELHGRLHEIPGPDWLGVVGVGDRLLHFDLHPENVILAPDGPVVIDWTNAVRGRPGHDLARAWVLMAAAAVEVGPLLRLVVGRVRGRLVEAFLDAAGREEATACVAEAVELTLLDPNIAQDEKAAMRALAARATAG